MQKDKEPGGSGQTPDESLVIRKELFDWAESLVFALVFIVLVFTFVVRLTGIDGPSMMETIHDGDQVLVSKLFYNELTYGDIVVFYKDGFADKPVIKRVIATGGQSVDINFSTGDVFVDGERLYEPYINALTTDIADVRFPVTVPDGCLFVMGDNRNRSTDSRDSRVGFIDERLVLGKLIVRVFPFNKIGTV